MPDGLVKAGRWMDGLTLQEFGKVLPNEACKQRNMSGLLLESHDQRRLRSSGGPLTLKSLQHSSSPSSPIAKIHVLHIEMYPLGFPLLSAFACHLPVEAPLSLSLLVGNENLLASDIQVPSSQSWRDGEAVDRSKWFSRFYLKKGNQIT
ncbi:hypothetical protein PGT21_008209 [Puccinia graminis f. sp. tritici]|uniref:Uncharacterized protein n=1 Tax=Puccinia graminis f. sp. tritici TaxID=56615 RepID=A0A5B0NBR9_PUCGR|nr:hypothetical protein PGT21_008209 [Puccinia graminis f. sp. tritici]